MQTIHLSIHTAPPWADAAFYTGILEKSASAIMCEWKCRCAHKMAVAEGFSLQVPLMVQTDREATTLEPSGSYIPDFIGRKPPVGNREEWPHGEYLSILPAIADETPLEEQCSSPRCVDEQNSHQSPQKAVFLSPHTWGALWLRCCSCLLYFSARSQVSVLCRGRDPAEAGTRRVSRWAVGVDESHLL